MTARQLVSLVDGRLRVLRRVFAPTKTPAVTPPTGTPGPYGTGTYGTGTYGT